MHAIHALIENVEKVIVGKRSAIELAVISILCRGHVLLEDVPGTGKTMLARALARSIAVNMKRLQCTPDLLPSDITGVSIYNQKNSEFEFRPGPIFTGILLADEINRATPRAQSALLECMEEFSVSVDGDTRSLSPIFTVLATQNPVDLIGTHILPEAQLDRFFVRIKLGYPSLEEEMKILQAQSQVHPIDQLSSVISENEILSAREDVKQIYINPEVSEYIVRIVEATRRHDDLRLGASPRGTLALAKAAKAKAYLDGKTYVTPAMVKAVIQPVLEHRIILRSQAAVTGKSTASILQQIADEITPPN